MSAIPLTHRPLGRTGLSVSPLGLGCGTFGREIDEAGARDVMVRAVDHGINLCDTSETYAQGASETVLGNLIAKLGLKGRVLVSTKVRHNPTRDRIPQAAEASLGRLRLDCIDLYLLHQYDPNTPLEETLEALDRLVRAGKVRRIGCSNFSAAQLARALALQRAAGWQAFEVVQPMYNLVAREPEAELLPLCGRDGIGVVSYSPIGAGFLTGKYDRGGAIPAGSRFELIPGHQNLYFREDAFTTLDRLRDLSRHTNLPMEQLARRWVFAQPGVDCFLTGARSPRQIDEAVEAWRERGMPRELLATFA